MKLQIIISLPFLCSFPVLKKLDSWTTFQFCDQPFFQTTFSPSPVPSGLLLFISIFKLNLFHLAAHPLVCSLRIFYGHVYCYLPLFVFSSSWCSRRWHRTNCICAWTQTGFPSQGTAVMDADCPKGEQRLAVWDS